MTYHQFEKLACGLSSKLCWLCVHFVALPVVSKKLGCGLSSRLCWLCVHFVALPVSFVDYM